ncbi:MAG: hypothetical protein IKO03_16430 [Lachnospiraceae bacterium]|nr:hypothetical protein [Lachnospiraceae bacterium]
MKDKKMMIKNFAVIACSLACIAFAGVFLWGTRKPTEDVPEIPVETQTEAEPDVQTLEVVQISLSEELTPSEEQNAIPGGIIIATGEPATVQPIQEAPKEAEEPSDPPALAEDTDLTNPDKVPQYAEDPKPTEKPADTVVTKPQKDDGHPGQMYIEGFGWVTIGSGNTSTYAEDMYMNGNKIGDM